MHVYGILSLDGRCLVLPALSDLLAAGWVQVASRAWNESNLVQALLALEIDVVLAVIQALRTLLRRRGDNQLHSAAAKDTSAEPAGTCPALAQVCSF